MYVYICKNYRDYQHTYQILNIILQNTFLQSYNCLKLRNITTSVKIMSKTWNFQHLGNIMQTNKNTFS
jgi:hypothetical protein